MVIKELRVYINSEGAVALGDGQVFYSRRSDGPYYCWRYEEELGQWHSTRMHPSELTLKALSVASWQAVPTTLQARLREHYLE